jgi:hypothetical protein
VQPEDDAEAQHLIDAKARQDAEDLHRPTDEPA